MSSRPDIHIQASYLTLHCDIFHFDIISSLFFDITYHHLLYSSSFFFPIITYSTLSLFHLKWWSFTHHYMEGNHILSPVHLMGGGSDILFWGGCLVSDDSYCETKVWLISVLMITKQGLELMIIFQVWLGKTISKVAITKTNQAKEKSWRRRRPQRGVFFKTQSS